jgi:hypothetical protein
VAVRIQMRRGTSSEWNDADPILNEGELGYNSTLAQLKIGDGSTIWSELTYLATDEELVTSLEGYIEISEKGAVDGVAELDASGNVLTGDSVIFEGSSADEHETTLTVVNPTADRTITLPDATGTLVISSDYGSGIGTWLGTPSSANLASAMTDETGSGLLVFNTSPSIETSLTTASTSFDLLNTTATTINLGGAATVLSIGANSGTATFNNSVVITGDLTVNGTTTTIDTQTLQVEDKNIVIAYGNTTDAGADGGGLTLLGATNKTFEWIDATDAWTSSEHMNLLSGKSYKINNVSISAALPGLTWGEVKDGKSGLVIS